MKETKIVNHIVIEGQNKLWEECSKEEQIAIRKKIGKRIREKSAFSSKGQPEVCLAKEEPAE